MTPAQHVALVRAFQKPPYANYKGWVFAPVHTEYLSYVHRAIPRRVYFTPDHKEEGEVEVQVQATGDGDDYFVAGGSWPFLSHDPADLFAIVKQWLDKIHSDWMSRSRGRKTWEPE